MSTQRTVNNIVKSIQRLYPKELADKSWDNTGLLLECPLSNDEVSTAKQRILSVLLTIDLTRSVVDEAINKKSNMIIAYHPFIFRGYKSITMKDSQQESLIRLAQKGISVYCPHTAIDAGINGVGDWLADGVSGGRDKEEYRKVIEPVEVSEEASVLHEGAGMGRIVKLKVPISLNSLIERIKNHLDLKYVQAATTPSHREGKLIETVAICAGSGGDLLRGVKADVHFTGEISHHEALHLIENGTSAIICGHTNTERGFLQVFKRQLLQDFITNYKSEYDEFNVSVSESDKDPLEVV